jgi:hypothetical protein
VSRFAREKPTTALLWALGIGFVLGWKLKPGRSPQTAEALPMVDTARSEYPADMLRAAHPGSERGTVEEMADQVLDSVSRFAREKPTTALLWALGIGFVLGWKLKPW